MDRRNFIYNSAFAAVGVSLLNQNLLKAMGKTSIFENANGRVLVLVQLNGGNDGLNTLVPLDKYDILANLRSNILIPYNKLLDLNGQIALHPSMTEMKNLFIHEKLMFIQNVGYDNPNLSHFRSKDIILSASESDEVISSGWIGRYMQQKYPDYPSGFPNETEPDPFCITVGNVASPACMGNAENYSMVIQDTDGGYLAPKFGNISFPKNLYGSQLKFITSQMDNTEKYLNVVSDAREKGANSASYPAENPLGDQLKLVARLISGGLKTPVYVVNHNGYDTHSDQVDENSMLTGRHANLLSELSNAIYAFQDDLKILGLEERVLGMVYSEFGRRVVSNQSLGCDHGTAFPLMLFGAKVNPLVFGVNPEVDSQMGSKDNLVKKIDFRSVYASILHQWLGLEQQFSAQILGKNFAEIPILKSESSLSDSLDLHFRHFPNPMHNLLNVELFNQEIREIVIADLHGVTHFKKSVAAGNVKNFSINVSNLVQGNYLLLAKTNRQTFSKIIVKK